MNNQATKVSIYDNFWSLAVISHSQYITFIYILTMTVF